MLRSEKSLRVVVGIVLAILLLGMLMVAVSAADLEVTITVATWHSPPYPPMDFEIIQTAIHNITLTWTPGFTANITIIRGSTSGYPFSVFDGDAVYSGNGTSVVVTGVNLDTTTYYYRAWGQSEYGVSTGYAEAHIGGTMATSGAILLVFLFLFPISFTGLYTWKREIWIGIVAAVGWLCMGLYLMLNVSASPSLVQISDVWMALGWACMTLGIVFALSPFVWKKHEMSWEEDTDDFGQPVMVQYVKGNKTGMERELTDLEMKSKEQKIKEEQENRVKNKAATRASSKSSGFSQTGKV